MGEHWSIDQVRETIKPHTSKIPSSSNVWDVYVGLNNHYHNKCVLFREWFGEEYEKYIIQDALSHYFEDLDCKEGKVWLECRNVMKR